MLKKRLHILGLPHTITSNEFSHCAFTGKVLRFGPMMLSRGFEVYHYGVEGSEIECTKKIDILTIHEWNNLRYSSLKYLEPEATDEEIKDKLYDKKKFIGYLGNVGTPLYKEFNKRLELSLLENYRDISTDIICLPFGYAHDEALKNHPFVCVESGIGYVGSYRDFRIFESYAILHQAMEKEKKPIQYYWFVIPNYYNISEWSLSLNPDKNKVGCFGRICNVKGCHIIVEIAKLMPHVEFVLCGQGYPGEYLVLPNITYKQPISGLERNEFLGSLNALLCLSTYVEPFCGVNVEAQLCGTPVIATHSGIFVESVENWKTGLLCHTLSDLCFGVSMAIEGKFDRTYIRNRAVGLWDMYKVGYKYEYAFNNILEISNGNNGWYSSNCHISLLNMF